jgi:hypothetical protein
MNGLVPMVEDRLRRQGVTSKHFRLGRVAAQTDGTPAPDIPMAALAHALALKDGLPVEFAVAIITGIIAIDRRQGSKVVSFYNQGEIQ